MSERERDDTRQKILWTNLGSDGESVRPWYKIQNPIKSLELHSLQNIRQDSSDSSERRGDTEYYNHPPKLNSNALTESTPPFNRPKGLVSGSPTGIRYTRPE